MKPIHDNCRRIREVWHMERVPMAELFGVTRGKWVNYELGTTEPPPEILLKLEELTGITTRRLWTEELTKSMIPTQPLGLNEDRDEPPQFFLKNEDGNAATEIEGMSIIERLKRLEELTNRLEVAVFGG